MLQKIAVLAVSLCLVACGPGGESDTTPPETQTPNADVATTPDTEWLLHGLSAGEQRHSNLDKINLENVSEIGLAFSFDDFIVRGRTNRGAQATPLMENGVLYFTGAWSVVYAVDARTGEHLWTFDPEVEGKRGRVACCDVVNRGVALSGDTVIVATIDGYLIALNKADGTVNWKVDTLEKRVSSYTITGAPRLAGDLVVIGNGGAEFGVRGYVTAYDIKTGEKRWRFYTVPGAGPDENEDVTKARETWSEDMDWSFGGGGTAWDSMVYDEELDTIFVGTGNATPWPVWKRGKPRENGEYNDNLYLSSIVALDANTGRVRWHYQTTPADSWDYTATQHMILADIEIEGTLRKVIMQAPKNGFFYTLDRVTGELLKADPYVVVSWAEGVDLETGRPIRSESSDYSERPRVVNPSPLGGHNWPPMAYNPGEGLVFIPTLSASLGFKTEPRDRDYVDLARNTNAIALFPDPNKPEDKEIIGDAPFLPIESRLIAWDPVKGEERWRAKTLPFWSGGVLSTAGGLAIAGSADGQLYFHDVKTGEIVHTINIGVGTAAPPITYELDGEQYIAVVSGLGGAPLAIWVPGYASMKYENISRLLVFKLGGGPVELPPEVEPPFQHPALEGFSTDPQVIANGAQKYGDFCVACHLPGGAPSGYPNIWNMAPGTVENFDAIVLGGAYEYAGMASFADVLNEEDTRAILAFIQNSQQSQSNERVGVGAH